MQLTDLIKRALGRQKPPEATAKPLSAAERAQADWNEAVAEMAAASSLAAPPLPKVKKGAQGLPAYRTQIAARATPITKPATQTQTLDRVANMRTQSSEYAAIRFMAKVSPEIGTSLAMLLRVAIPEKFTVIGRTMDGQFDRAATEMANELLRRLTFMGNADGSFGSQQGLQSLSETLALDAQFSGAMALEVSLDTLAVPASFNVIGVSTLVFYEEKNSFSVKQKIGGVEIDLDIPTFIYTPCDQVVTEAYPTSPLTGAVQAVMSDLEFNNDVRKALKRAVLPRLVATLDSAKILKATPPEIASDPEKLAEYQNALSKSVEDVINGMNPEDALVGFDFVSYSYIDGGHDPSQIIERVQKVLNAKLVAGARTMPVTLGFTSTSNAGSAESLLFLKQADGIRRKLNETYSRALTVAIRLTGIDGYVEFEYDTPNLRPEDELEAFRAIRQSRILEQLSLGLIGDDEAGIRLTGQLPPAGAPKLSGTMFNSKKPDTANPASNTSNATEQANAPKTPTEPKTAKSN